MPRRSQSKDIDGGYAWVVMIAFFLMNILVDGVRYSFGLYFVEFLEEFKRGKGITAWIGSLMIATYNLAGPVFAFIVNKFGCRLACAIGSITTAVAFLLSAFVPDMFYLFITFGVLQGFGFGLMYLSGTVAVGRYFFKKRARALGFGLCGAGVGMLGLTPFVRFVIDTYAWRGSMFVLAGLALNGCVLAMLMRPMEEIDASVEFGHAEHEIEVESEDEHSGDDLSIGDNKDAFVASTEGACIDDVTDVQLDNKTLQTEKEIFMNGPGTKHGMIKVEILPKINGIDDAIVCQKASVHSPLLAELDVHDPNGNIFRPVLPLLKPVLLQETAQLSTSKRSLHRSHTNIRSVNMSVLSQSMKGSNASFEYIMANRKLSSKQSEILGDNTSDGIGNSSDVVKSGRSRFGNSVIESMFPKVVVVNVDYQLFMVTCLLAGIPAFIPYSMLPDLALTSGATLAQSSWTLPAIGIGGTVSRIVGGWLSDMPCVHNLTLLTICLFGCGITAIIVAFFHAYIVVMAYSVCYGLFFGAVVIVQPIVFLEYLGEEYIAEVMGSLMFTYGITQFIGNPMAGGIFDATSSYTISFVVAGLFFLSAGVLNQCVLCTKYCKKDKKQRHEINLDV